MDYWGVNINSEHVPVQTWTITGGYEDTKEFINTFT